MNIPFILGKLVALVSEDLIESSKVDEVTEKLQEIKYRRDYRNIFAHWAAKRIPNEDGMIFLQVMPTIIKKFLEGKLMLIFLLMLFLMWQIFVG